MLKSQGLQVHKPYTECGVPNFVQFFLKWVPKIVCSLASRKAKFVPGYNKDSTQVRHAVLDI